MTSQQLTTSGAREAGGRFFRRGVQSERPKVRVPLGTRLETRRGVGGGSGASGAGRDLSRTSSTTAVQWSAVRRSTTSISGTGQARPIKPGRRGSISSSATS
jgi:hypothetical protein